MAFNVGSGSSLQMGIESTFGAGATPTSLIDFTSESINTTVTKADEGSLLASKTAQTRDLNAITVDGGIDFVLRPDFAGLLFRLVTGKADTVGSSETSGDYKHSFTLCDPSATLPSATVIVDRKGSVRKFAGCTISSLTLDCPAGDYVTGSVSLVGTKDEAGTLTTLSPLSIPAFRCTSASFKIGEEVFDITTSSLTIDNALESAPRTYSSGLHAGQPQHGMRSVQISFEIPYSADVETFRQTYLMTETLASIELHFASSNSDYFIDIKMPNVSIGDLSANVGGTGIITASGSGEALSVGTDEPIIIELNDKKSTAY